MYKHCFGDFVVLMGCECHDGTRWEEKEGNSHSRCVCVCVCERERERGDGAILLMKS